MNKKLPDDLKGTTISSMKVGQTGYTVPWAMYADKDCALWLNSNYSVFDKPGGTVQMIITRETDGFQVDVTRFDDHKWGCNGSHFSNDFKPLPVIEIYK